MKMTYQIVIDHDNLEVKFYAFDGKYRKCELVRTDFMDDDSLDTLYLYIYEMAYDCDPYIKRMFDKHY